MAPRPTSDLGFFFEPREREGRKYCLFILGGFVRGRAVDVGFEIPLEALRAGRFSYRLYLGLW